MPDTTYLALIRGINVGGNKKIKMADLRAAFEQVGCTDVATYIQSGNVVLRSTASAAALTETLESAIEDTFGFSAAVIVRTAEELAGVVDRNPWPDDEIEGTKLVVWFYGSKPATDTYDGIDRGTFAPETFVLDGRELFLHLPDGQGRSKLLEAMGKVKGVPLATARNWKSVTKLLEMTADLSTSS